MIKAVFQVVLPALFFPCIALAQEYSYSHYNITEGLAGSTVYCITQDKDGFIWAGTDAGVSRFDGAHFKNFTTKDGLPDIEVLQIFTDTKGRVWMAPFHKSVCFYYQGKIHNKQNDALLSRIDIKGNIDGFAEDAQGNVLMYERNALHLVNTDGSVLKYDSLNHEAIRKCRAASTSSSGHFIVQVGKKIIEFSRKQYIRSIPIPFYGEPSPNNFAMRATGIIWSDSFTHKIWSFSTNKTIQWAWDKYHNKHISYSFPTDSQAYINESSGTLEYNINTGQQRRYLSGIPVSRVFRDATGNLWFTTLGEGLFRLNSNEWKTIHLTIEQGEKSMVTAITKIGNDLWVGDNHSYLFRYALPDMTLTACKPYFYYVADRILFIDSIKNNNILTGSDCALTKGTRDFHFIKEIGGAFKSAARINDRELLLGTSREAGIFDLESFRITDTLAHERVTTVFYKEDTIYFSTLNGLYRSVNRQSPVFLGKETPFLRKRIASIAEAADGMLWIASYDAGIIGYKNNKQVIAIGEKQGLTSDICRTLLVHNNTLWVGTDKGLNKIELNKPGYPVTQYTYREGLAADMVNTLFADGTRIYVGTADGLSFLDEQENNNPEACRLYLLSLVNSNRERITDTGNLVIPYTDKRVRFEFAAIAYRSAGNITYKYRMAGLDNIWRETKDNFVEYPDLPSGDYEWQLIAINKFGKQSRLLSLPITVAIQFWKKPWFIFSVWLLSFILLWWLISRRVTRIRRRQAEKERLLQEMSTLKNTALTSQMNPHFIFNCLNSIQQFIFTGDITASNKYIAGLGKLIRITLNNSSKSFICIHDEVDYLSSYLALEKMRFKEKIDYEIIVDASIDQQAVLIPPMLIQPFVENALKHGLQPKTGDNGFVSIQIKKDKEMLVVTVQDNGIGRRAAADIKSREMNAYASKGLSLTEGRIDLMNKLYKGSTRVAITDLNEEPDGTMGTRITISLPLFREQELFF